MTSTIDIIPARRLAMVLLSQNELIQFKQHTEYDCGVYALAFYLFLLGHKEIDLVEIREHLDPRPEYGTQTQKIFDYLYYKCYSPFTPKRRGWNDIKVPSLVIFQHEGEGHYGVVTNMDQYRISIFEPYNAEVVTFYRNDFLELWRSTQSGKRWMLRV